MDFITESFQRTSVPHTKDPACALTPSRQQQTEPDLSEFSSQDTTLLEMREQAQLTAGTRDSLGEVSPCGRNFFRRSGGLGPLSQDPQIQSTIPSLKAWCHVCWKNFSVK